MFDSAEKPVITVLAKFAYELSRELLDFAPVNPKARTPFVVAKWDDPIQLESV